MNYDPDYVTIIDTWNGQVVIDKLPSIAGEQAFHAAESRGCTFVDGRLYLTQPVNSFGVPVNSAQHTLWTYNAPVRPKATASRFETPGNRIDHKS